MYTKNSKVFSKKIGNIYMLLQRGGSSAYQLNETAGTVWKLLDKPHSADSLVSHMLKLYDVSEDELRNNINSLLKNLQKNNLVIMNAD